MTHMPTCSDANGLYLTTDAATLFLDWYRSRDSVRLEHLMRHLGYQTVLDHSEQCGLRRLTADDFIAAIEGRPSGLYGMKNLAENVPGIVRLVESLAHERDAITAAVADMLRPIFAPGERQGIGLHCIVGYDIGIGLNGNVAINLNSSKYLDNPAEIGYFLGHEAAHVAYYRIHGPLDLRRLHEPGQYRRDVCLLIQTEGMSVFAPLAARLRDGQLQDRDYQALLDPEALAIKIEALRELVAGVGADYPGDDVVGDMFGRLSGQRLSYVVGCEIFRRIEARHGMAGVRAALLQEPEEFVAAGLQLLGV